VWLPFRDGLRLLPVATEYHSNHGYNKHLASDAPRHCFVHHSVAPVIPLMIG
jgi:hypothetical protein